MVRANAEAVAIATGEVVALYEAGVAMEAIAIRTRLSRTTIRKILVAEGVPRRPTGRPRMMLTSQTVADLYESGLTMPQVADRLSINPNAAWARYVEVRDRRGVIPRRWHQILRAALEEVPVILVVATGAAHLRRDPTTAEAHAVRRAARELARVGVAETGHITVTRNGHRGSYLSLARPGFDPDDPQLLA